MTKKYPFYMAIILMLISILLLCWNLFLSDKKNNALKTELDIINADYALLVDTNSSISQELTFVKNKLESTQNELTQVENECAKVKNELEKIKQELEEVKQENLKWSGKYNQYPEATIAWVYMTEELGWSDIVAAGIMGNMMAECGGHTLALDWDVNGSSGYGLIQWIGSRRTSIKAKYGDTPTIIEQLEFVKDELYGTNGVTKQVTDSQLNAIMNAATPEECAFAFATYYERCSVEHRAFRRGLARTAYKYFTTET